MNWKLRCYLAILGSLCHRTTCKKGNAMVAELNDLVYQGKLELLFQSPGKKEEVWNPGDPLKGLLVNTMLSEKSEWKSSNHIPRAENSQKPRSGYSAT